APRGSFLEGAKSFLRGAGKVAKGGFKFVGGAIGCVGAFAVGKAAAAVAGVGIGVVGLGLWPVWAIMACSSSGRDKLKSMYTTMENKIIGAMNAGAQLTGKCME